MTWADPGRGSLRDLLTIMLLAGLAPALLIALSMAEPYAGAEIGLAADQDIWFNETFLIGTLLATPVAGALLTRFGFLGVVRVALAGSLLAVALIVGANLASLGSFRWPVLGASLAAGLFSAPLAPAAQAFAIATHSAESRGRAMAKWGAGRFAGFLVTAVLAGRLIDDVGWSVPLLVGAVLGLGSLPLLRQPGGLRRTDDLRPDLGGLALLVATLLPMLVVLNFEASFRGVAGAVTALALVAASLAALHRFVRHVRRVAHPIVSLEPLADRSFRTATLVALVVAVMTTGQFSILMVGSLDHVTPEWLGWRTAAGGIAQIVGVIAGGWCTRPRLAQPATVAALLVTALGTAGFTLYGSSVDLVTICATRAVMGLGLGLSVPLIAAFAYARLDRDQTQSASALFVFAGMVGTALGVAALGALLDAVEALTGSPLAAYRTVFWVETAGVALLVPLVLRLRLDAKPA